MVKDIMVIIEKVLGNISDGRWKGIAAGAKLDELRLSQWDAQKNRLRKTSEGGTELAISLERKSFLHDGDVLSWDAATKVLVVAKVMLREVLVIDLSQLSKSDPEQVVRTCFELGHALGNQHWPAVVKEYRVFVPLTVDKKVMSSVMRTHGFKNISYDFAPGAFAIPYLLPHEARRLFGGAEQQSHAHHAEGGDVGGRESNPGAHGHDDDHDHSHTHGHGHGHHH